MIERLPETWNRHLAEPACRMLRAVVKLWMVCALMGPPALCRIGVLVQCCENGPAEARAASSAASCCDDRASNLALPAVAAKKNSRQDDPIPRKCGACAAVCSSVAKPNDDDERAGFAGGASHTWPFSLHRVGSQSPPVYWLAGHGSTIHDFDHSWHPPNLPFPPPAGWFASDFPLLI